MTTKPPPYPADTRAKGWRFELDYEQIEQSDTWPLAAEVPMCQHALLMMWLQAWAKQVPCGSFPDDEELIRAKCRIPPAVWSKCRDVLMRGWWRADDGRLYHPTLTQRVLEMMGRRRSESDRKAARRARDAAAVAPEAGGSPPNVPRDNSGTTPGIHPESSTDHRPPTTKELPPAPDGAAPPAPSVASDAQKTALAKAPKRPASPVAAPNDVDAQVWADWLTLRRQKRAAVTATVLDGARGEAGKAGMTLEDFLRIWCRRGSQGLEAAWLTPAERPTAAAPWTAKRQHNLAVMTGGLLGKRADEPYPSEIVDVAAIRVG